ncbi:unnamed protein product, partial [Phaeothamnion confervicola]
MAQRLAHSLREAAALVGVGGPTHLILRASPDLLCRNLFCEHVGGPCTCRLAMSLEKVQNVEVLDISDNSLKVLPDVICALQKLRHLDLSGNELSTLPRGLGGLPHLEVLRTAGNPLSAKELSAL